MRIRTTGALTGAITVSLALIAPASTAMRHAPEAAVPRCHGHPATIAGTA